MMSGDDQLENKLKILREAKQGRSRRLTEGWAANNLSDIFLTELFIR